MLNVIRLLPDSLANQIAAGEVVQRPASVVKELLENSIDAGSQNIRLIIKDAGKTLIQVIDDGAGMSETDARMCFERHATSKITSSDDLFHIMTLGFRGEAMASIAAVAQVEMKTRRADEEMGTFVQIEGSKIIKQEPVACNVGTNTCVKNLFFNVPARRNFLKTNSVELKHIIEEFQRVALAHPDIGFAFYQGDMEVYNLKKGKLAHRIVSIFGKNYKEQLIACNEEVPHTSLRGYIGKPEFAKKTRGEQFFFVNNRYIRHSYLHHAVMTAYEGLLPDESFPLYVLFIDIDPKRIDVNVHPTKTEIKFDDERTVYAIIHAAVKQALGTHHVMPPIDFEYDVNYTAPGRLKWEPENMFGSTIPAPGKQEKSDYTNFKQSEGQRTSFKHWEKLYPEDVHFDIENIPEHSEPEQPVALTLESAANQMVQPEGTDARREPPEAKINFQLHNSYIVSQVKSGMMIIDQQAAHEQVLYERYLRSLENRVGASQQLLFPQEITFNMADIILLTELETELLALGFVFESKDKNTIILRGVPADLRHGDEQRLLEGLLEQFKMNRTELSIGKNENIAMSMARRSAIRKGTYLTPMEMNMLIDQLFGCSNPNYAPDGRKTFTVLGMDKIEGLMFM